MTDNLTIKSDYQEELKPTLKNIPYRAKLALADGLDHSTRSFYALLYKTRLQGPPGIHHSHGGIFHRFRRIVTVKGKKVFLRQQASQSESVRAIAKSDKDAMNMKIELYSTSKVAGIHETGGTITGKGMPIPLNAEAKRILKQGGNLSGLDAVKINGKVFLGRKRRFRGGLELLFILKRSVRIKPRLGFYSTWDKHAGRRNQIIDDAFDAAMEKI